MRLQRVPFFLLLAVLAGCAAESATKPVEYLDERTAMTVGSLKEPIEFVPSIRQEGTARILGKLVRRLSFAYLGPVEWDRSGTLAYGLWIHIAPGNDRPISDIHAAAALLLNLDEGPLTLTPIDAPQLGRSPYEPVASWGQTAYFDLNVDMLKHMAASQKLELSVLGSNGTAVIFIPSGDTRATLSEFLRARGITGD
jgi:hypothetical protein